MGGDRNSSRGRRSRRSHSALPRLQRSSEGRLQQPPPSSTALLPALPSPLPPARRPRLNPAAAVSDEPPSGGQQQQRWEQVDARDRRWRAPSAVEARDHCLHHVWPGAAWRRASGAAAAFRNTFFTPAALCSLSVLFNAAARSPPTGSPPARPRRLCLPIHSQLARCVSPGSPSPPLARLPVRLRSRIRGSAPSAEAVATSLLACDLSLQFASRQLISDLLALLVVCSLSLTRLFSCLPACRAYVILSVSCSILVLLLLPLDSSSFLPSFLLRLPSAPSFLLRLPSFGQPCLPSLLVPARIFSLSFCWFSAKGILLPLSLTSVPSARPQFISTS